MTEAGAACWAVVPAAGLGQRMGATRPKQYLPLLGKPVIEHSLTRLLGHPRVRGVVVALSQGDPYWGQIAPRSRKPVMTAVGGPERCHSVVNALQTLRPHADPEDWVLVHDAARPCVTTGDLDRLVDRVNEDPIGGILATPVRDTMKRADGAGRIEASVERSSLWHALTPQMFRLEILLRALQAALRSGQAVTDEASSLERQGHKPLLVEGRADNIKITRAEDLALAAFLLQQMPDAEPPGQAVHGAGGT